MDDRVTRSVEELNAMTQQEVAALVDELADRVYELEQGVGATTQFQMVKVAEGPDAEGPMGKHTRV